MSMTTVQLPKITKSFASTLRNGKSVRECWEARTTDGVWAITRQDDPGTPWTITHIPTGTWVEGGFGTLRQALVAIAKYEHILLAKVA